LRIMEPIILASSSPQRQVIFKQLNIPFKVVTPSFDEVKPNDIDILETPEYFAAQKVKSVVKMFPTNQTLDWVLGADTSIIYNNKLFGKPKALLFLMGRFNIWKPKHRKIRLLLKLFQKKKLIGISIAENGMEPQEAIVFKGLHNVLSQI